MTGSTIIQWSISTIPLLFTLSIFDEYLIGMLIHAATVCMFQWESEGKDNTSVIDLPAAI